MPQTTSRRVAARAWLLLALMLVTAGCTSGQGNSSGAVAPTASSSWGEGETGIQGLVVDAEQLPLVDATVTLFPGAQEVVTGPDGAFAFRGLEAGAYTLRATRLGYVPRELPQRVADGHMVEALLVLNPVPRAEPPRTDLLGPYVGQIHCDWSITLITGGSTNGECGTLPTVGPTPINEAWPNDNKPVDFRLSSDNWSAIVFEAQWTPASAASRPDLVFHFSHAERRCQHHYAYTLPSASPLKLIYHKGDNATGRNVPTQGDCGGQPAHPGADQTLRAWLTIPEAHWAKPVEYAVETKWEMRISVFYNHLPSPDYSAFPE
jgi:hypothetical protein